MVLNPEPHCVELVYAGQNVAVTETATSFENERQKVEISLVKSIEQNERFGIVQNISREQPTQRPLIYYPVHKREGYFSTYPLLKDSGCIGCSELQDCSRAVNMVMDKLQCDEKEASSVILESIPTESIDTLIESGLNSANDDSFDDVHLADGSPEPWA